MASTVLSRWRGRLATRLALARAAKARLALARRRAAYWRRRKERAKEGTKAHSHAGAMLARRERQVAARKRLVQRRRRQVAYARRVIRRRTGTSRGKALAWFRVRVGIVERPPGSNGNPANISRWQVRFGFGRVPWCGIACGMALLAAGVRGVTARIAGVALIEDDARARRGPFSGWSSSVAGAKRGDLVVIGGRGEHVEMIRAVHPDGSVSTYGGNTSFGSAGSQSNGGCVAARRRNRDKIHGVAHVRYP